MIVFPVKPVVCVPDVKFCMNCNHLFKESPDTKDYGICSLSCGYQIRGLSRWDFLDSSMDKWENELEVLKSLGRY